MDTKDAAAQADIHDRLGVARVAVVEAVIVIATATVVAEVVNIRQAVETEMATEVAKTVVKEVAEGTTVEEEVAAVKAAVAEERGADEAVVATSETHCVPVARTLPRSMVPPVSRSSCTATTSSF